MFALPSQTKDELVDSLELVTKLNPKHISLYSLILEENTELKKEVEEGKLELIDEDTERRMYHFSKMILEDKGYLQYEISNFALKGYESKHNLDCWNQEEYLGFGLSAHSYYNNKRYSNTSVLNDYIENIKNDKFEKNIIINEVQTEESKMKEYMMLRI